MSLILVVLVLVDCLTQLIYLGDTVGSSLKKIKEGTEASYWRDSFFFQKELQC